MKLHVNLLPGAYRRRTLIRRRVAQWSVVWGIGAAVGLCFASIAYQRYEQAQQVVLAHERAYAPLQYLKDETTKTKSQVTALGAQESVLEQLRDERPALTILGLVSRSAWQTDGRIRVDTMTVHRELKAQKGERSPGVVTLKGTGLDNLAVAKFVVALRATGAFDQVELKSSSGTKVEGDQQRDFMVECQY